jgi:hypothetical protein
MVTTKMGHNAARKRVEWGKKGGEDAEDTLVVWWGEAR